jgi:hypothetical protein
MPLPDGLILRAATRLPIPAAARALLAHGGAVVAPDLIGPRAADLAVVSPDKWRCAADSGGHNCKIAGRRWPAGRPMMG